MIPVAPFIPLMTLLIIPFTPDIAFEKAPEIVSAMPPKVLLAQPAMPSNASLKKSLILLAAS